MVLDDALHLQCSLKYNLSLEPKSPEDPSRGRAASKIELKGFNLIRSLTACSLGPRPSDAQAVWGFSMLQPYCASLDFVCPWILIIMKSIPKTPKISKSLRDQFALFLLVSSPEWKNYYFKTTTFGNTTSPKCLQRRFLIWVSRASSMRATMTARMQSEIQVGNCSHNHRI